MTLIKLLLMLVKKSFRTYWEVNKYVSLWSYFGPMLIAYCYLCDATFNLVLTHIDDLNEGKLNVLKIRNDIFIWILSNFFIAFSIRMRSFSLKNLIGVLEKLKRARTLKFCTSLKLMYKIQNKFSIF